MPIKTDKKIDQERNKGIGRARRWYRKSEKKVYQD